MPGLKFHFSVKMNRFLLLNNWRTKRTRSRGARQECFGGKLIFDGQVPSCYWTIHTGVHRGNGALLWLITVLVMLEQTQEGVVFQMSVQSLNGSAMHSAMLTVELPSRFLLRNGHRHCVVLRGCYAVSPISVIESCSQKVGKRWNALIITRRGET
jgi:hypothetical protein